MRSGRATAAGAPGRVVSAGRATRGGREDVRLALTGPARLILAESYTRGRRASCDGEDLGVPEVGDGYGTAWRVPASCRAVAITFAPNRLVNAGYALSLLVGVVLLGVLLLGRRRLAEPEVSRFGRGRPDEADSPHLARLSAGRAALIAIPVALAFGFVFAARGVPLFAARRLPRAVARDRRQAARARRRGRARDRGPDPHDPDPARGSRWLQPRVLDRPDRGPLGRGRRRGAVRARAQ